MKSPITKEEIMSMKPGHEMNALVWLAINEKPMNISECRHVDGDIQPFAGYPTGHISPMNYSGDIRAAWNVWIELVEWQRFPTVHQGPDESGSGDYFFICVVNPVIEIVADSFPLGICQIALLTRLQMESRLGTNET